MRPRSLSTLVFALALAAACSRTPPLRPTTDTVAPSPQAKPFAEAARDAGESGARRGDEAASLVAPDTVALAVAGDPAAIGVGAPPAGIGNSTAPTAAGVTTPASEPAWTGPDCQEVAENRPRTLLCRDKQAALAFARATGDAPAERPRPKEGSSVSDPLTPAPGLELYQDVRKRIGPRAKFTPIVFQETPPLSADQLAYFAKHPKLWQKAKEFWKNPKRQFRQFRTLWRTLRKTDKPALRAILLRSGYVFTADRQLARYLYRGVRLPHLFDEPVIYLQRGDEVHRLEANRRKGYVYADGPLAGRQARFFLFDRLAVTRDELTPAFHWDIQAVRYSLGLQRVEIEDPRQPVLPFSSTLLSGERVEGVLFHDDGRTAVALAGIRPERWADLYAANHARAQAKVRVIEAAERFVDEWIRFDEPDIEFGQEDGVLREAWIEAYEAGLDEYEYNGIRYKVFGGGGVPIPPQVCVDFLMDAIERASGRWWLPRGQGPGHTPGSVNWADYGGLRRRSVQSLIRFAKRNPEIFEVYAVPESRQVKFEDEWRFYRNIETFPVDFREGDIIVIWGYREDEKRHFHSFFVHTVDPIDGFPIMLADNAGLAAIRVWQDVMRTAPQRYLYYHLRIRDEWLLQNGFGL